MSDELVFMMGEFEARFPTDRRYAKNHMWARESDGFWRVGFTAYAVRLLQDVYFLDWTVDAPTTLKVGQEVGMIESKKAESSLYSPLTGELAQFNGDLMEDPSAINVDKYGNGWLFDMIGPGEELKSPAEYIEHLEDVWVVTQRTIKGQLS